MLTIKLFRVVLIAAEQQQPQPSIIMMFFPLIVIGFLWYFLMFRPQKEEQTRRDDMLNQLKKNDRIVTVGGILGTVANATKDSKEVTVKVDDNTRLKILRSHIAKILNDTDADQTGENDK